jgi:perosamine synthetase
MSIPLFKIHWDDDDLEAVNKVIKAGSRWCIGPSIDQFEEQIRQRNGVNYCVTFNSGGSALHALMLAHKIGPGSEVIVPSFTFIATALTPLYVGARPVFADIERESLGLDPEDVKAKLSSNTKAIMPIHFGGFPCLVKELREIAQDAGVLFIEDAAEAYGAEVEGTRVGALSNSAIFSFCQNKVLTTGEGGCAVTDDEEVARRLRLVQSYGRQMEGDYFSKSDGIDYVEVGYNWRLSSMAAALGLSQLNKVDELIRRRRENAAYLDARLGKIAGVELITPRDRTTAVYQMYTVKVRGGRETRDALSAFLKERNIASKVYFEPAHNYTVFKELGLSDVNLPSTAVMASEVLTLPFYPYMTKLEMDEVIGAIEEYFAHGH